VIRRAAPWLLAWASVALPAANAQAPSELRIEAGYARVIQALGVESDAGLLSVFWRRPFERWEFLASGNLTYGADSVAGSQGVVAASIPWTFDERFRTEGGLAGARFSLAEAGRGGNLNGFARQHFITGRGGGWVGTGGARTSRDGERAIAYGGDVGAWGRLGFLYGSASASLQQSNDWPLITIRDGIPVNGTSQGWYTLQDLELVVEARRGPNSLAVSWSKRHALDVRDVDGVAVSSSGILQITERVAFTATVGRQLIDPLRGLPQADLMTAAIRVSLGRKPLPVMARSEIARATVEPAPGGGGELVVHVFAADTMIIDVAGDFSDWQPVPLVREGGLLVARVRLAPGKYRVAVRVNLGDWRAPRNLARVRDDYGGEAGIVIVP
jgi:hypothetical protein